MMVVMLVLVGQAQTDNDKEQVTIKKLPPTVVLYTIYRGDYAQMKTEIVLPVMKVRQEIKKLKDEPES